MSTGFSLDASVRIEGADRAGRERLLRYCARPPFALVHLHEHDAGHLLYHCPKPRPNGPSAARSTRRQYISTKMMSQNQVSKGCPVKSTSASRAFGMTGTSRSIFLPAAISAVRKS